MPSRETDRRSVKEKRDRGSEKYVSGKKEVEGGKTGHKHRDRLMWSGS